jgi:hypothetical protein
MRISRRKLIRTGLVTGTGLVALAGSHEEARAQAGAYSATVQSVVVHPSGSTLYVNWTDGSQYELPNDPLQLQAAVANYIPVPGHDYDFRMLLVTAWVVQDPTLSKPSVLTNKVITWDPSSPRQLISITKK